MQSAKIYFPDGHLEKPVWDALIKAGYNLYKSKRGYMIDVDHPDIIFKQVRPQIMPFYIMMEKGDGGFTGEDILENSKIRYGLNNVVVVDKLPLRPTKLVVAISKEVYTDIKTIDEFRDFVQDRQIMLASEYPEIAKKYADDNGLNAVVFDPIGKTEASLLPPQPEADMIIEVTEYGTTLRENECVIIDTLMDSIHSVFIANTKSYEKKKSIIDNLIIDLREVLNSQNLVSLIFNIPEEEKIEPMIDFLTKEGFNPTVSKLAGGGVAIHIILNRERVKFLKPRLRELGARRIGTQPIITFGD
jgi:ATP phosphoribosyltransferase